MYQANVVMILPLTLPLPLDGNLRDARCSTSDHRVFDGHNHRPHHILRLQAATSCKFSAGLCLLLLMVRQDSIRRVMHSPMSFFETTVRTIQPAVFLLLSFVRSRLVVL
jgi:hypothetical protein